MSLNNVVPTDDLQEIPLDAGEVANAARQDPDFLAALAMPEVFTYMWPPVFKAVWTWLLEASFNYRLFQQMALGLPRGFGKTTMVKLYVLFIILFTERRFILIISATAKHAENIISDVADMLDEPNIRAVFGNWRVGLTGDTQSVKRFGFRGRNIILAGLGAGGSVRGLNIKNARPDVMIFEDIQKREEADSQAVSEDLYKWLLGTAMKAKSPKGCLTLFIANMYPTPHSILKKLKGNKYWVKFIAGGILEDGSSLWEELQPIAQLLAEYESDEASGHPEIFHAEVLNDENASVNNLVDFGKIPPFKLQEGDIPDGKFIIIDPSNDKANSDAVSIGYFEVHNQLPVCMEIIEDRLSPSETIRQTLGLCTKYDARLVAIESNAYQYSLKFWSEFICQQLGVEGINFVDIYSGQLSKNTRIMTMFKSYMKGEIIVHPRCQAKVHSQMAGFNALKRDNVDGILDLLTYSPKVLENFGPLLAIQTVFGDQEFNAMSKKTYTELDNSSF